MFSVSLTFECVYLKGRKKRSVAFYLCEGHYEIVLEIVLLLSAVQRCCPVVLICSWR